MEVRARAKFIRMSPRKVRQVIDLIRGLDVEMALDQLVFVQKWAKGPVMKLVNSAIANAEHNYSLTRENLYIKEIRADMGPTLKRFTPKAFGRAALIRKRTTHIQVILGERVPTQPRSAVSKDLTATKKDSEVSEERAHTNASLESKKVHQAHERATQHLSDHTNKPSTRQKLSRRIFQRKSG